jgi:ubiquinone/menaquinone biosynthesis C-methylase UbiE
MNPPELLSQVLRPDAAIRHIADRRWTSLPPESEKGAYDAFAGTYDKVIANRFFSPAAWGCPADAYESAVRSALDLTTGGYALDAPCGSMVFSNRAYGSKDLDRTVLFDRSLGMVKRANHRHPAGTFLHGDIYDSPFRDAVFGNVMSWGLFHVVGTTPKLVSSFRRIMADGAPFSMYTLVLSQRPAGNAVLRLLHRIGQAAPPETAEHVTRTIGEQLKIETSIQHGNMLFITARNRA